MNRAILVSSIVLSTLLSASVFVPNCHAIVPPSLSAPSVEADLSPIAEASTNPPSLATQLLQKIESGLGYAFGTASQEKLPAAEHYPWRTDIVTTTFWVGESTTPRNPVPNRSSCWDPVWARNYGGTDEPEPSRRSAQYIPVSFTPHQNPFYCALPYNDVEHGSTKPEAAKIIPWFKKSFNRSGESVLKDRWIAIRSHGKVAYAQWEDAGPFRTDHWQYVFGNERPKKNLNKGAGLDVSPAVRDFLKMNDSDVTDWRFVDFSEVPSGPWAQFGNNNTFVKNVRARKTMVATGVVR